VHVGRTRTSCQSLTRDSREQTAGQHKLSSPILSFSTDSWAQSSQPPTTVSSTGTLEHHQGSGVPGPAPLAVTALAYDGGNESSWSRTSSSTPER
jgi:hypothetical protein